MYVVIDYRISSNLEIVKERISENINFRRLQLGKSQVSDGVCGRRSYLF